MSFQERVWKACSKIPKGRVATYKTIAHYLGSKAYRAVGMALKNNPYRDVPCHRVVKNDGKVGGYKGIKDNNEKIEILKHEGIIIKQGKIDLSRYEFKPKEVLR